MILNLLVLRNRGSMAKRTIMSRRGEFRNHTFFST
uniref:Uncharacterized protein n=1 Tax=Rhizophora mucronata TaxID=61149 RepID=A0A2P2PSZ1_RHIMU